MDYLLLVVGLALLLLGANYLVDSSVAIAKRAKISNFIIGLTIVGIGTSAPELFVSIQSALTGHGDIAMGNVVGSNITNLLLILGVTAVICPFAIEKQTHRSDIPFGIFAHTVAELKDSPHRLAGYGVEECGGGVLSVRRREGDGFAVEVGHDYSSPLIFFQYCAKACSFLLSPGT